MINANRYINQIRPGVYRARPELRNRSPLWITPPLSSNGQSYPISVATAPSSNLDFLLPNFNAEMPGIALGKYLVFEDSTDTTGTAATTIKLTDVGYQRDFMAWPLHIRALFGTAQLPGMLHEPIIFDANSVVQGAMNKITGGAVNQRPYIVGSQFYDDDANQRIMSLLSERKKYVSPFWMMPDNITAVVLTANQSLNFISQMSRGNFQALSLVAISTGNFSVEIRERRTGRTLMNGQVSQSAGIGDARYPYFFEAPFMVEKSTDIQWRFTDLSNSGNTIYCAMQGKLFNAPMREIGELERDLMIPWDKLRV